MVALGEISGRLSMCLRIGDRSQRAKTSFRLALILLDLGVFLAIGMVDLVCRKA